MTEYVVSRADLKDGDTHYQYGDRFDRDAFVERHGEGLPQTLQLQGYFVEATRESVRNNLTRRPGDAPWPPAGFTEAYLASAYGYERPGAAPAKAPDGVITHVDVPEDAIPVGRFFLVKHKSGVGFVFDAVDASGALLRDKGFRKEDKAREFLAELEAQAVAAESTAQVQPVTPEAEESDEGKEDGGDVQS